MVELIICSIHCKMEDGSLLLNYSNYVSFAHQSSERMHGNGLTPVAMYQSFVFSLLFLSVTFFPPKKCRILKFDSYTEYI